MGDIRNMLVEIVGARHCLGSRRRKWTNNVKINLKRGVKVRAGDAVNWQGVVV